MVTTYLHWLAALVIFTELVTFYKHKQKVQPDHFKFGGYGHAVITSSDDKVTPVIIMMDWPDLAMDGVPTHGHNSLNYTLLTISLSSAIESDHLN